MVRALVTVSFSFNDEPTVNSQIELAVATSPICPVGPSRSAPPRRSERHPSSDKLIFTHIFCWTPGVSESEGREFSTWR